MNDPASAAALDEALRGIERDYPRWYCWAGVNGTLYARIPGSSPPVTVHSATADQLRAEVHRAERLARETGRSQ